MKHLIRFLPQSLSPWTKESIISPMVPVLLRSLSHQSHKSHDEHEKIKEREPGSNSNNNNNVSISNSSNNNAYPHAEWRKQQLDQLQEKFIKKPDSETNGSNPPVIIDNDEDLQPMWKQMENRVRSRRLRTLADTGGKSGRQNIKQTDEDVWLEQGLYDSDDKGDNNNKGVNNDKNE